MALSKTEIKEILISNYDLSFARVAEYLDNDPRETFDDSDVCDIAIKIERSTKRVGRSDIFRAVAEGSSAGLRRNPAFLGTQGQNLRVEGWSLEN